MARGDFHARLPHVLDLLLGWVWLAFLGLRFVSRALAALHPRLTKSAALPLDAQWNARGWNEKPRCGTTNLRVGYLAELLFACGTYAILTASKEIALFY